jgi:UDP-galactopyranose mutase
LARSGRVFFIEEPLIHDDAPAHIETRAPAPHVHVLRPHLPSSLGHNERDSALASLLRAMLATFEPVRPIAWFYTQQMLVLADQMAFGPEIVVYDCMDELSAFRFADPRLCEREAELLGRADVVFNGGLSLYDAKRPKHDNIHAFPSSVDHAHFARARAALPAPADQASLPHPRIGYYGVIDERLDLELIAAVAAARPGYAFVFVGPLAKVDPSELPRAPNIHYLSFKSYDELPVYLANWSVASMPFAMNEATRFIGPTKTLEYLAGGKPVVSTPVGDVARQHGELHAVEIAADAEAYARAIDRALQRAPNGAWREEADAHLADTSWDSTHRSMDRLVRQARDGAARRPSADRFPTPGLRRRRWPYDVVVAGAGFAGAVMAGRLASMSGLKVLVCDKREHIGGNAYDRHDGAGILIHPYGPHIFHTNSQDVVRYLSRSRAGAHMNIACSRRSATSACRCRSTAPPSTACSASRCRPTRRLRRFSPLKRSPSLTSALRATPSSRRWERGSTAPSSRVIRSSNGACRLKIWISRSRNACRRGIRSTTGILQTAFRRCRPMDTRACLKACRRCPGSLRTLRADDGDPS